MPKRKEEDSDREDEGGEKGVLSVGEFALRMRVPFSMAVASQRNSGKTLLISVLIKDMLELGKVEMVLVMSQTVHVNKDYAFLPPRLRQPFSEAVIKKLMDKQAAIPKKDRQQVLLVLDDVLSEKAAEQSRFIKRLYTLGRHYDINVILISQTSNVALTQAIKQNSDYILYSRLNRYQLSSLWESITNMDKRDFIRYSEAHNKNYTFLCVDNTSQSNNPADFILRIKASPAEVASIAVHDSDSENSSSESETDASESEYEW
jgi:hypothetical protein